MQPQVNLTRREKRHYFIYLILLFLLAATILLWALFRRSGPALYAVPAYEAYQEKDREFLKVQQEAVPLFDTIFSRVRSLQTATENTIAETDLKNQINVLNSYFENLPSKDPRFVSYHQMALFSKLYLEDMMIYRKKMENIGLFKKQLEECEVGYKEREAVINQIKTAQAARN